MLIAAVLGLTVLGKAAVLPKTPGPGVVGLQAVPRALFGGDPLAVPPRLVLKKRPKVTCAIRVLDAGAPIDERMVVKLEVDVDPGMVRPSACED